MVVPPELVGYLGKKAKYQANVMRVRKDSMLSEKERRRQENKFIEPTDTIVIPLPPGFQQSQQSSKLFEVIKCQQPQIQINALKT